MKVRSVLPVTGLLALLAAGLVSQHRSASTLASLQAAGDTLAFVNVNVIPMDRERVVSGQTILVAAGRIAALGPTGSVHVPVGAVRVDGQGRMFILPGLADMHAHVRYESDLMLLLSGGVTTVRNMGGSPFHLDLRRRVAEGTLLGPRIITAGPQLRGDANSGATPEGARAAVDSQAKAGYDFIKPYDGLPKDSYEAAVAAAAAHHMKVSGHVPTAVGVLGVLREHQASIEHAEQIVYHYFAQPEHPFMPTAADLDTTRLPAIARAIAEARTYVTPTLATVHQLILKRDSRDSVFRTPDVSFANPETYAYWRTDPGNDSRLNRVMYPFLQHMVRVFRDRGVRMLAGTDYYLFGMIPGLGLHRELAALVEAGLTPYQALETATRIPAEFLGDGTETGTVAAFKVANLLVLDANPLADIRNVSQRAGVVVRGRWLPAKMLDQWADSLAASFVAEDRLVDEALLPGGGVRLAARGDSVPAFQQSTLEQIGDTLLSARRFNDAAGVYQLLTRRYSKVPFLYIRLGDAYAGAGRKPEAIEAYESALRLGTMMKEAVQQKIDRLRTR